MRQLAEVKPRARELPCDRDYLGTLGSLTRAALAFDARDYLEALVPLFATCGSVRDRTSRFTAKARARSCSVSSQRAPAATTMRASCSRKPSRLASNAAWARSLHKRGSSWRSAAPIARRSSMRQSMCCAGSRRAAAQSHRARMRTRPRPRLTIGHIFFDHFDHLRASSRGAEKPSSFTPPGESATLQGRCGVSPWMLRAIDQKPR